MQFFGALRPKLVHLVLQKTLTLTVLAGLLLPISALSEAETGWRWSSNVFQYDDEESGSTILLHPSCPGTQFQSLMLSHRINDMKHVTTEHTKAGFVKSFEKGIVVREIKVDGENYFSFEDSASVYAGYPEHYRTGTPSEKVHIGGYTYMGSDLAAALQEGSQLTLKYHYPLEAGILSTTIPLAGLPENIGSYAVCN